MGVYSHEAAVLYKENTFDPNADGLLEFAINSQRADKAMFDAVIEMDFLEYYQESGQIVLEANEQEEGNGNALKAIGKKIVDALKKFLQVIQVAIQKLINFVAEKTKIDEKLAKSRVLDLEGATAKNGDKEITFIHYVQAGTDIENLVNEYSDTYTSSDNFTSVDEFNKAKEEVKKNTDALLGKFASYTLKKKIKDLKSGDIQFTEFINKGGYKKVAEDVIVKVAVELKKKVAEAAKDTNMFKILTSKDPKDAKALATAKYAYISSLNSNLSKIINFGFNITTHALAESRKTFIAVSKKKDEKIGESAEYDEMLDYALEVATDAMYDEASFG